MKVHQYMYAVKNLAGYGFVRANSNGSYLYSQEKAARDRAICLTVLNGGEPYGVSVLKMIPVPEGMANDMGKMYCYSSSQKSRSKVYLRKPKKGPVFTYELVEENVYMV